MPLYQYHKPSFHFTDQTIIHHERKNFKKSGTRYAAGQAFGNFTREKKSKIRNPAIQRGRHLGNLTREKNQKIRNISEYSETPLYIGVGIWESHPGKNFKKSGTPHTAGQAFWNTAESQPSLIVTKREGSMGCNHFETDWLPNPPQAIFPAVSTKRVLLPNQTGGIRKISLI